jgi:predicted XRE-type DNA-binding protein
VFADLGFGQSEASELSVKAELTRQIHNRIRRLGLTQVRAAERLGVSQPDVSKLMNGRHTGYSIERLISLLNALAMDIDIVVRPKEPAGGRRRGVLRIMEAARVAG